MAINSSILLFYPFLALLQLVYNVFDPDTNHLGLSNGEGIPRKIAIEEW